MKKTLWLALILLLVCVFAFSACDSKDTPPTNNENNQQTTDNNNQNTQGSGNNVSGTPTECQHAFGSWNTVKQATCNEEGKLVRTCSKCSETEESTVSKTDVHTEVIDAAVTATCTVDGKTEGKHCSVCGKTIIAQTVVKASGHTEVVDPAVEATCKAKGKTEGKHCSVCNTVIIKQTDTAIIDHDYQSGACTMCKAVDTVAKQAEIDAENERHKAKLAQIEEYYPSVISGLQERINNLKDAYGITYVYSDSYCYDKISSLTTEIRNLERKIASLSGSTNSSDVAERRRYEAQLTQKQNEQDMYYKCITINGLSNEITYTRAYYSEAISDENATHTANLEAIEIKYTCASNGHTVVTDKAIDPTCTVSGRTEGTHCSVCNAVLVATQTISATGHNYGDWSTILAPTCDTTGTGERTCSKCNASEQEVLAELGHSWGEWIVDSVSTCALNGQRKHVCSECNSVAQEETPALSHIYTDALVCSGCGMRQPSEGIHYSLNNSGTEYHVSSFDYFDYQCYDELVIAEYYEGKKVTAILSVAYCKAKTIYIPDTVTYIGTAAFAGCSSLTEINVPDSVNYIGPSAFDGCYNLQSIILPFVGTSPSAQSASVYTLFGSVFGTSNYGTVATKQYYTPELYKTYYIPSTLTSVTITGGQILYGAFYGCNNLTSITIGDGITSISESAFSRCSNLATISIGNNVTSIGNNAFYWCNNLKNVVIPNNVTSIGSAFTYSGIESIIIPNTITSIDNSAFAGCTNLKSVIIPNSVTRIGVAAFANCLSLTIVTIPNSVTIIDEAAFKGCERLLSITIPDSVTSIGFQAFAGCYNLISVKIGKGVTYIGDEAFWDSYKLVEVIQDESSTAFTAGSTENGFIAFSALEVHTGESKIINQNGLLFYTHDGINYLVGYIGDDTVIELPNSYNGGAYVIYDWAFYNCTQITSIVIPNTVTAIGNSAFRMCGNLDSIVVPNSVSIIGVQAFLHCNNLKSIRYNGTITQWRNLVNGDFYWNTSLKECIIYCTNGQFER